MQSHRLVLDTIVDQDFTLIAIHSAVEEYRMAFLLNKNLNFKFARAPKDVDFKHKSVQALYQLYRYYDEAKMRTYFLVNNKFRGSSSKIVSSGSLFASEFEVQTTFLISEFKRVDYFLKIEDLPQEEEIMEILSEINKIPVVTTAYKIDPDQIRTNQNLIFE